MIKNFLPKVSVIVPVYNVEQYISQCLDSLVNQTLKDIEIICVDDCGTDGSMEIVRRYADKDERIVIIKNPKNMGLSFSRNVAIERTRADYIMFCDSDDYYRLDMCEKMFDAVQNADIAVCGTDFVYEKDYGPEKDYGKYFDIQKPGLFDCADEEAFLISVTCWNKIYHKDIINKYDIQFPVGLKYEDTYFTTCYMQWVRKIFFVQDKLYHYRHRSGSIMEVTYKKNSGWALDLCKNTKLLYEYLMRCGRYEKVQKYYWKYFFIPHTASALSYAADSVEKEQIYDFANSIIASCYKEGAVDLATNRLIERIKKHDFYLFRTKKFGGISVIDVPDCFKVKIFGLTVFKVVYSEKRKKVYMLRLRVC